MGGVAWGGRGHPWNLIGHPLASPDLIGSWPSSSTQETNEMPSINDDSWSADLGPALQF